MRFVWKKRGLCTNFTHSSTILPYYLVILELEIKWWVAAVALHAVSDSAGTNMFMMTAWLERNRAASSAVLFLLQCQWKRVLYCWENWFLNKLWGNYSEDSKRHQLAAWLWHWETPKYKGKSNGQLISLSVLILLPETRDLDARSCNSVIIDCYSLSFFYTLFTKSLFGKNGDRSVGRPFPLRKCPSLDFETEGKG